MKKNILKFPESSHSSLLMRYDKSHDPGDFLDAIEETFRKKGTLAPITDRLAGFIESVKAKEDHRPILRKACTLLAKFSFVPLAKPVKNPQQSRIPSSAEKLAAAEIIDAIDKSLAERRALDDKAANTPYGAYPPAYPYVDMIPKVFGENDPVKIICEYLSELQPVEAFHHPDDCWFSDDERISVNADERDFFLRQLLPQLVPEEEPQSASEFACWTALMILNGYFGGVLKLIPEKHPVFDFRLPDGKAINQISVSEQQKLMRSLTKGLGTFDGFLMFFFSLSHFEIPQGLFVAVVRYWLDCEIGISESDASRSILRSLVNYPLGRPAQSWDEISIGVADPAWLERIKQIYKEPTLVPFLPCRMSTYDWFFRLSDSAIPTAFSSDNGAEFSSLVMGAWSNKISFLRNNDLGGRYPWPVRSDVRYLYDDYEPSNPAWDTHIHFLALLVEEEECGEWNWESDRYGDDRIHNFRSFQLQQNFWSAADREGYPELGNALLAFYLLRKSLMDAQQHQHLEVDWAEFPEFLRTALTRPGHAYVRKGVEFMKATCNDKSWNLDLLRLKNIVPDSGVIIAFPAKTSPFSVESKWDIVNRTIETQVGSDLWGRLSARSRKMLVEAEMRFQAIAQSFGTGITEFGPETLAYARAFENELKERLQHIYGSKELKTWVAQNPTCHLPTNLTIDSCLRLLDSDLPPDVIKSIEVAGVMLRGKRDILKRLAVLKNRRNDGAHTSKNVTADILFLQRTAVFEEHLLKDFLSALSSRATN